MLLVQKDACAATLHKNPHSCQLSTAAALKQRCAREDAAAGEGRDKEQNSHHPPKPLHARKRGNKRATLYLEGIQACHLLNEVGEDQACPIESSSQGTAGTGQSILFSCLTRLVPSILLPLTYKATPSLVGPAQGGGGEQPLGTSPAREGTRGRGSHSVRALVPGPPEEKETSRDRQLRDRQETGTRSAQMQEPRSELQTKVIRQAVLNSRVSKGFIGRAPSGK